MINPLNFLIIIKMNMVLSNQHCCSNNNGTCSINNFKLNIVDLIKNLEDKLIIKYSDIEKIRLNLKILENSKKHTCQCHAIVENIDGRTYQCTRKKKYGNLCGLHHNRKNSFKTIESNQKTETHQFLLDVYSLISDQNNVIETSKLHKITHNYVTYLLDSGNGNVFLDDPDDYSDTSSIDDYDSLCNDDKKSFTDKLIFIGNVKELNMPFKIL